MLSPTEEIKSKIDIVDLINEYVPLKPAGANFKARCPFHAEKTPSFMVSREKQFFKCFGCGESGDIFSFLQKYENIEFPEALRILAERAGVKVARQDPKIINLKTRLLDLHQLASDFFSNELKSERGQAALAYLKEQRKLNDETIKSFKLGYAPDSWQNTSSFLKSKGFSDYELKQSGLVVEKTATQAGQQDYYDRFRDRIIFPIEDHHANIVGFTARAMKQQEAAKYINTPQTPIYNKSQILYGLAKAKEAIKKNNLVVLVEGNMDVIASHQAGIKNVIAASGTSLTEDQIKIIFRYTDNVAMSFDADEAGVAALRRSIEMLWQQDLNIKVIILPAGIKDPDELIQQDPESWQGLIKNAQNFMDYFFDKAMQDKDLTVLENKRAAAKILLPWINRIYDPISKDHYIKLLSEKISIDEQTLHQALLKYDSKTKNKPFSKKETVDSQNKQSMPRQDAVAQRLLCLLIYYPPLIKKASSVLEEKLFFNQKLNQFYNSLIIYYTKSDTLSAEQLRQYFKQTGQEEVRFFDSLELYAKTEFEQLTEREIYLEFEALSSFLKQNYISSEREKLQNQIKQAERVGNTDLAVRLLEEFVKLK